MVVDNGSTDGSVADAAGARSPTVPVIDPGANLGYGRRRQPRASRRPVRRSCAVLQPGRGGRARAPRPRCSRRFDADARPRARSGPQLAQPRRHARTRRPGRAPSTRRRGRARAARARSRPSNRFTRSYRQLDADPDARRATSTGSRAPRSGSAARALDRVGGWDERFFMFFEDVDLCRRLGADGWTRRVRARRARDAHRRARAAARRPVRSIVEHHRAAYRYVDKWWRGPAPAAAARRGGFLAARGAVVAVLRAGAPGRGPRSPGGHRVTCAAMAKAEASTTAPGSAPESAVRSGRGGSMVWIIATVAVVVVGTCLLVVAELQRPPGQGRARRARSSATTGTPILGVNICGDLARRRSRSSRAGRQPEPAVRAGHPLPRRLPDPRPPVPSDEAGNKATRRPLHRLRRLDVSSDSIKLWTGTKSERQADQCPTATSADSGEAKGEVQWTVGKLGKPWTASRDRQPGRLPHRRTATSSRIYFLPEGREARAAAGRRRGAEPDQRPRRPAQRARRAARSTRRPPRAGGDHHGHRGDQHLHTVTALTARARRTRRTGTTP